MSYLSGSLNPNKPKADPDPLYSDLAGSGPALDALQNKKLKETKGKLFLRKKELVLRREEEEKTEW